METATVKKDASKRVMSANMLSAIASVWRFARSGGLYVAIDWSTSLLSFMFLAMVYRFSAEGAELGGNAWLLSLVNTAFFISMAVQ